jgi:hypothetical protein
MSKHAQLKRRIAACEVRREAQVTTIQPTAPLVQAFIANEEMDNVARYLRAGRRLAHLSDLALKRFWADAWRAYYDERKADRWSDCQGADAELTLRQLPRPERLIPREARRRIVARAREAGQRPDVNRRLREDIQDFVCRCAARRN